MTHICTSEHTTSTVALCTSSDEESFYVYLWHMRSNLCVHVQISTDLNISNGIIDIQN
jgi:hypothetical protein